MANGKILALKSTLKDPLSILLLRLYNLMNNWQYHMVLPFLYKNVTPRDIKLLLLFR